MARLRRLLPLLLLLASLAVSLLAGLPGRGAAPAAPQEEVRGVWMTLNDMATLRDREKMRTAVARLQEAHFNTIYAVVWNGGYAYYPSAVTRSRGIQRFSFQGLQGQDVLAELIEEAHARGMLVMPWFEFGFMAPPSSELAQRHPDWLTQRRDGSRTSFSAGGEVVWLNPLRPEVQSFITDLVLEVVDGYDADGIQFDDHTSLPRDFGYDAFTTGLYARETGRSAPAPQDPAWVKWRADKITAFMGRLHEAATKRRKGLRFSVSPNYYDFAYKLQLQDWLAWLRRGIADEIVVQIYRPDLESFVPQLERPEMQEARGTVPTAVGIMSGQRTRPVPMTLIEEQVRAARGQGLGVAFFYYESLWDATPEDPELRRAGFRELFRAPAPR